MKKSKSIAIMFNLLVSAVISSVMGAPAIVALLIGLLVGFVPGVPQGAFGMALQKEIWEGDIVEGLFADNSFLSKAYNADNYVLAGKVVHIPQAGAASGVVKNRTTLPATVVKRTDTDLTYSLDEYTTNPVLIPDADKVELSYDKRQSVISEDKAALMEAVATEFLYKWSPSLATSILRTDGASVSAHLPSATGLRKSITLKNVRSVAAKMNATNVPQENRYCAIDSVMYDQLIEEMSGNQQRDFLAGHDPINGTVGKYAGFSFYMRSKGARYSNAETPVAIAPETEAAATDNAAALFWQLNSVERAMGEKKAFDNPGDATYYGDILSFLVRAGGRKRRTDQYGIIAVIQTAVVEEPAGE